MKAIYYTVQELEPYVKASKKFREESEKRGEEEWK